MPSSTVATEVSDELQLTSLFVASAGVTVAVRVIVSPSSIVISLWSSVTPVTGTAFASTVTAHVAVLPPSLVFTVIVALPGVPAVTTPFSSTDATPASLVSHVTLLSPASSGVTVAVRVAVSPLVSVSSVLSRLTPVTATAFAFTVTVTVALKLPSFVVIVITAVPGPTAVTTPFSSTVTTLGLLDVNVTSLMLASDGSTV